MLILHAKDINTDKQQDYLDILHYENDVSKVWSFVLKQKYLSCIDELTYETAIWATHCMPNTEYEMEVESTK